MPTSSLTVNASLACLALCMVAAPVAAQSFSHNDWELACDNTRTCRAAGYHSDSDAQPTSVLLTRKAGPGQAVAGQLMLGQTDDVGTVSQQPKLLKLSMRVNGKALGTVLVGKDSRIGDLSSSQVAALLLALPHASTIEWASSDEVWRLSDKGAAAVLLKMDEWQGRVGTLGALIRKGPQPETAVLPPLPMPTVIAVAVAKGQPGDLQFLSQHAKALRTALPATVKEDDCDLLTRDGTGDNELNLNRLTDRKLLVTTQCWGGAYNFGQGYWVVDNAPPFHPVLVTTSGSRYAGGSITAAQKGRGLGDCWSSETWTWDGKDFVHTASATTGMCKSMAAGGAWSLPTIVTDVRPPAR